MPEQRKIDSDAISRLFAEHSDELVRFLTGVAGDQASANDAVQTSFAKLLESGGPDQEESSKAWLFRVAYNEALAARRKRSVREKAQTTLSRMRETEGAAADNDLVRRESVGAVQAAVARLPAEQQVIVRMRIYDELTFAQIADRLEIPIGTALTRMRAAQKKLREALKRESPDGDRE